MLTRWITTAYLCYLAAPIALLVVGSFGNLWLNTLLPTGFTAHWYADVAGDPSFRRAFAASLAVAAITCVSCVAIGLPLAYAVFRTKRAGVRAVARIIYQMPVALPALVLAFGFILVFSSDTLPWLGSIWLLAAGHVVLGLPYFLQTVVSDMQRLGLGVLEEAAESLGSGPLQRFLHVVLPALRHSILSGLIIVAALSIGEFQLSNLVAGFLNRTYPVVLLQAFYGATGFACAATVILLALALAASATTSLSARGAARFFYGRAMNGAQPAVDLAGVTYRYAGGKAGIFDVSLAIEPGELVVCIGPSGCGKTTLLRVIAGFLRPEAGTVKLSGIDVTQAPARAHECGVVFQAYALFPHMRVWENVAYPLRVRDVPLEERRQRAGAMLELVGLSAHADRLPAQLSGGQQQRVALARALVFNPRALLLDEPLSALDAATRVTMREEIRRIQKAQNIAALLITHDQDEALSLADRIAVLRDGRLVQYAAPHAVYDRPADAFVAGFVGRANLLDGHARAPDGVDTPIGALITLPHGRATGTPVRVLLRPERIEPAAAGSARDLIPVRILRDRFFGATRRVEVAAGEGRLEIETAARHDFAHVRVPPEAVQFLSQP